MSSRCVRFSAVAAVLLTAGFASTADAQPAGSNQGRITWVGGLDFSNAYLFRGLLQDDTRIILWPFAEAAAELHRADDGLQSLTVHIGTWNSLHTGDTGLNGLRQELWYESDVYGTVAAGFADGIVVSGTYMVYTSPSNLFSTIQELIFKATFDDIGTTGIGINPHALVAFELTASPNLGQADGGLNGGTYLEIGATPGWNDAPVNLKFPIKLGFSLNDYYELAGVDHKFGYLSLAAVATVPFATRSSYGSWNVHGGVEFLSLGNTPEAFNRGDQTALVASVGVSFSY
jgi:hypothetical protein